MEESAFSITGKCTVQNWEIISKEAMGEAEMEIENNKIQKINSFKVEIPSKSFKSGNRSMNKHAIEALKAETNPNIIFNMKKIDHLLFQNNENQISVSGNLTVAGVTKPITLKASGSVSKKGVIFQGRLPLKMSDFKIDPPTFVLGSIKTQDDVLINFHVLVGQGRKAI